MPSASATSDSARGTPRHRHSATSFPYVCYSPRASFRSTFEVGRGTILAVAIFSLRKTYYISVLTPRTGRQSPGECSTLLPARVVSTRSLLALEFRDRCEPQHLPRTS